MLWINFTFDWLVTIAVVSLAVLAIGTLLTWCWARPIERLRCIQATFVAIAAACLLQQFHFLPQVSLGWLSNGQRGSTEIAATVPAENTAPRGMDRFTGQSSADVRDTNSDDFRVAKKSAMANAGTEPSSTAAPHTIVEPNRSSSNGNLPINLDWLRLAVVITFLSGFTWSLLHLILGAVRLRTLRRNSSPATAETIALLCDHNSALQRRVTLLVSSEIDVPLTFGIRRPVVMLPAAMINSARPAVLRDCLAHEWSHICHHDIAQWWLIQAMQPLFWYQPLFWLLRRELRLCQDQLADHFAVGQVSDAISYAEVLLELAKTRQRMQTSLALTMNDGRSNLFRRVQLLVSANHQLATACRSWTVWGAVAILLVVTGALGTINLGHAEAPDGGAANGGSPTPPPATIKPGEASLPEAKMDAKLPADAKTTAAAPPKSNGESAKQASVDANTDPSVMGEELPDGSLHYSGVVIDRATQKPVAGAVVTVRRMIVASYEHKILEETKHTTDEHGKYSFVIPPHQVDEKLLYIELDV